MVRGMLRVQAPGPMEENLGCVDGVQQMIGETSPQMAWLSHGNHLQSLSQVSHEGVSLHQYHS